MTTDREWRGWGRPPDKVEIISGLDIDVKVETWVHSFWGTEHHYSTDITDTPESPFAPPPPKEEG